MHKPRAAWELPFIIILAVLFMAASCSGCAGQTDPLERQMQYAIDAENWALCEMAYDQSEYYTTSRHSHARGQVHRTYHIQDDLMINRCRIILGRYWISQ